MKAHHLIMALLLACACVGCSSKQDRLLERILRGNSGALDEYIASGYDVNVLIMNRRLLSRVVRNDKRFMAERLLESGANPNLIEHGNATTLINTVYFSKPIMVKLLLDHGADTSKRDDLNNNALYYAVGGNPENVYLLALHGADVNNVNLNKDTPLMKAVENQIKTKCGYVTIVTLLSLGANVNCTNSDGMTPRMMAEKAGDTNLVQLLRRN